jgi:hypothetical protein
MVKRLWFVKAPRSEVVHLATRGSEANPTYCGRLMRTTWSRARRYMRGINLRICMKCIEKM